MKPIKDIYVVTIEDNDTPQTEVGYATTPEIAEQMKSTIASTPGFESMDIKSYKSPLNSITINNAPVTFPEPDNMKTKAVSVNLHKAAAIITDIFENILDANDIQIPDEDRNDEDENQACLYGMTYDRILTEVEDELKRLATTIKDNPDIDIITDVFND